MSEANRYTDEKTLDWTVTQNLLCSLFLMLSLS